MVMKATRVTGLALASAGLLAAGATGCSTRELNIYVPSRNVDILFVVDDSSNTAQLQRTLIMNFPILMQRLEDPPGLADLHLAVVSTDMGAGDGSIARCDANGGKNGVFQYAARGTCAASGLEPGATYISSVGGVKNYTGKIEDVVACIAPLGESGCGFEHPLAAAARALGADGRPAPAENQGFLRPEAFLFVVVVTNEDDCSAPPESDLFDTKKNTSLDSMLGPPTSFRCNEFGHLCNGEKPPRLAPTGHASDVVSLAGCVSAEHDGMLIPVATIKDQLRTLKPYPDQQILVGAITGPASPYFVHWTFMRVGGLMPSVSPACISGDGSSAAPAVRITQWVGSFGDNGVLMSACGDNFAPAFDRVAQLLDMAVPR
jgi:hypothetical protein